MASGLFSRRHCPPGCLHGCIGRYQRGSLTSSLTAQKAASAGRRCSPRRSPASDKGVAALPSETDPPGTLEDSHTGLCSRLGGLSAGGLGSLGAFSPGGGTPPSPLESSCASVPCGPINPDVYRICDPFPTLGHRLLKCILHVCAFLPNAGRFWSQQRRDNPDRHTVSTGRLTGSSEGVRSEVSPSFPVTLVGMDCGCVHSTRASKQV